MLQSLGLDGRIRFSTFPYAYCKLLSCFGTILSYVNLCLRVRYKKKKCMSDNISLKRWYETSFLRECLNLLKFDVDIIEIYLNECFHARSCGSSCGCLYINIYIYIYMYLYIFGYHKDVWINSGLNFEKWTWLFAMITPITEALLR